MYRPDAKGTSPSRQGTQNREVRQEPYQGRQPLIDPVQPGDVSTDDFPHVFVGNPGEGLSNHVLGARPGGVRVRIVRRPGDVLRPEDLAG